MSSIYSLIAFLNKLLDLAYFIANHKKKQDLKKVERAIDENIEKFATSNVNSDALRVYTPDGKPPTLADLQRNAKPE